jgi:hypothetical protein
MEVIFEILFEIVFELVLQVFGEVLFEVGLRSVSEPFKDRETRSPLLAFIGYALAGAAVGGLSLLVFPGPLVRGVGFRGGSLIVSPLLAGAAMSGLGWLRRRQGKRLLRLDRFVYGAIFAFGMALVRFLFTS